MTLPTLIAELEEAERAATPLPWTVHHKSKSAVEGGPLSEYTGFQQLVSDSYTGRDDIDEANARLIALMRTHLPTLLSALSAAEARAEAAEAKLHADKSEQWTEDRLGILPEDFGTPALWKKMAAYAAKRIDEGERYMTITMAQYHQLLLTQANAARTLKGAPDEVEAVARAICATHDMPADDLVKTPDGRSISYWQEFEDQARAAISAIRQSAAMDRLLRMDGELYDVLNNQEPRND